jgi:hypothetical protein
MPNSLGNARNTNKQIEVWIRKMERVAGHFDKKAKRKILIKASRPVVKAARRIAPKSAKPHYRGSGTTRIKYNPGNLRRSIKRLPLRRTSDAIIGPQFAKSKVMEYGGPGQPNDAYYAAMIYGSSVNFNNRVLSPALATTSGAVINIVRKEALDEIKKNAAQRGIKTN